MTMDDAELLQEFVVESKEHLADVESHLLKLEEIGQELDVSLVNKVFRAVHSIKGAAGFLGLEVLEALAHREEEVLDGLRNREIPPTKSVIDTLLSSTDCLKHLLDNIDSSNEKDVSGHIHALEAILSGSYTAETTSASASSAIDNQTASTAGAAGSTTFVAALPNGVSPEALREFLIESYDNIEQLEQDLVTIEREPENEPLLHRIFRNIHTIKGTAGFLAFHKVERLTHAAENVLGQIRCGALKMNLEISSAMLKTIDVLRNLLVSIESAGNEGDWDSQALIDELERLRTPVVEQAISAIEKPPQAVASEVAPSKVAANPTPASQAGQNATGEANVERKANATTESHLSASDTSIRVDVALLDKLMTRVGELVLARNQILQHTNLIDNADLLGASQRLNLITTELQEGVMKTRMQPIGNVWSKFPRLVRDLASICGKEVRIEMEGKDTELDKTIIEAIKDPLTHLVRNTVDHGIERPEVRAEMGKLREGCLFLRAFHEGGQVNIEISDDGAGLNLERIKEKALEKGLVTIEQIARMQEPEVAQLIFLPGFSTAEKVSNVSGRGVGMDVVKTNIEKIGGTVDLHTKLGLGTTIKIKIPLTLAIIPALVVSNRGNRFAIPQVNLLELVRLEGEQTKQIEWIQGAPVYRLRGRLLPLVFLREVLDPRQKQQLDGETINIVVLRADDRQFGLVVDRINDTEEIVVKPLSKQLKNLTVYSGATIMGDGKVALILDVLGVAHAAHVVSRMRDRTLAEATTRTTGQSGETQTLLILGVGDGRRLALPISQVARLEKISRDQVEIADHQEVVQYRGEIMPIIRLADFFQLPSQGVSDDGLLNVVVYTENRHSYGLVVDRIHDIVETLLETQRSSDRDGLLVSAVIHDHVTDIVDLPRVVSHFQPKLRTQLA